MIKFILFGLLTILTCAGFGDKGYNDDGTLPPDLWSEFTMNYQGDTRRYFTYTPAVGGNNGVVVLLHGQSGNEIIAGSGQNSYDAVTAANQYGFTAIAPRGRSLNGGLSNDVGSWFIDGAVGTDGQIADEVQFIHNIVDETMARGGNFPPDAYKIAIGFSNGAGLASLMICADYPVQVPWVAHVAGFINDNADFTFQNPGVGPYSSCTSLPAPEPQWTAIGSQDFFIQSLTPTPVEGLMIQFDETSAITCPSSSRLISRSNGEYTCYQRSNCPDQYEMCLYNNLGHDVSPTMLTNALDYLVGASNGFPSTSNMPSTTSSPITSTQTSSCSSELCPGDLVSAYGKNYCVQGLNGGQYTVTDEMGGSAFDWSSSWGTLALVSRRGCLSGTSSTTSSASFTSTQSISTSSGKDDNEPSVESTSTPLSSTQSSSACGTDLCVNDLVTAYGKNYCVVGVANGVYSVHDADENSTFEWSVGGAPLTLVATQGCVNGTPVISSTQPIESTSSTYNGPRRKILCLHGGGGSASGMRSTPGMQALEASLGSMYEFVYANSGYNGVWMRDPPNGKNHPTTDPHFADASLDNLDALVASQGPFYGILGYSQGAAFVPIYLAHAPVGTFQLAIMFCGYLPTTHLGLLGLAEAASPFGGIEAISWMGAEDNIIPNHGSHTQAAFFTNPTVIVDPNGGHSVVETWMSTYSQVVALLLGTTNVETTSSVFTSSTVVPSVISSDKDDEATSDSVSTTGSVSNGKDETNSDSTSTTGISSTGKDDETYSDAISTTGSSSTGKDDETNFGSILSTESSSNGKDETTSDSISSTQSSSNGKDEETNFDSTPSNGKDGDSSETTSNVSTPLPVDSACGTDLCRNDLVTAYGKSFCVMDVSNGLYIVRDFDENSTFDWPQGGAPLELVSRDGCVNGVPVISTTSALFTSTSSPYNGPRRKILCLHGGGGSASGMSGSSGTQALEAALGSAYEFVYATGGYNGLWIRDPPNGKGQPTTDPAFADDSLLNLDTIVAEQGPFYGILGYSQGAAFVPVYLAHAPVGTFQMAIMFCGYLTTTHQGILGLVNNAAPFGDINALVWMGAEDTIISNPMSQEQASIFTNPTVIVDPRGGHSVVETWMATFPDVVTFMQGTPNPVVESTQSVSTPQPTALQSTSSTESIITTEKEEKFSQPSSSPITMATTESPTFAPTDMPSASPTSEPSDSPTESPSTSEPSFSPTELPSTSKDSEEEFESASKNSESASESKESDSADSEDFGWVWSNHKWQKRRNRSRGGWWRSHHFGGRRKL